MEGVQRIESRGWIVQEKVNVSNFLEVWRQLEIEQDLEINDNNLMEEAQEFLHCVDGAQEEGDDQESIFRAAAEDCDPLHLTCDGENESVYALYEKTLDIPEDVKLETLRLQKQHLELYKKDRCYRTAVLQSLRYRNTQIDMSLPKKEEEAGDGDGDGRVRQHQDQDHNQGSSGRGLAEELVEDLQAVLSVQMFRPMHSGGNFGESRRYAPLVADQELNVLSSQYLTQLKDAFACVSDIAAPGDCSDNPSLSQTATASDVYKSGFFFINNMFYNDMRFPTNRDYSEVICNWAQEGRGIGPLSSRRMEATKFSDLEIRLGQPYLYLHQSDCEHIIVFTDLRLLTRSADSVYLKDYPKFVSTHRRTQIRCGLCNLNTGKWVTFGNKRLPEEPYFFCDCCFHTFNYDKEGDKIGDFKAFPYLDRTALL